jgi:polyphosphate glucokinase
MSPSAAPIPPTTLAIDIGATGLKASVLDGEGHMLTERARIETTFPMPPKELVADLVRLVKPLPEYDRISVGFPGVVRKGVLLSVPHFITTAGPGTKIDSDLVKKWDRFNLGVALTTALGRPTRVANDVDLQGLDVVSGHGLEVVVMLGTGVGVAVFQDGRMGPRLELSHHPFRKGATYNEHLGDAARKKLGAKAWSTRVHKMIATLDSLVYFDRLFIGGANAERIKGGLGDNVSLVDPNTGILGSMRLWDHTIHH